MSQLRSLVGQHFAFASGRTGVLQQILLTASDRDRLLGTKDLKEAEAVLTELKMTNPIDQGLKASDDILHAIGQWMRSEVELMAPESKRPVFHILWLQEDAPLLSYLLKKHHGLTSSIASKPRSALSAYKPEDLEALVEEGTQSSLPSHLVDFVHTTKLLKSPLPQEIDYHVANFIAGLQKKLARTSGSKHIVQFTEHLIDSSNIRTALRHGQDYLIVGGSIAPKMLQGDTNAILSAIDKSSLPYGLSEKLRAVLDQPSEVEHIISQVLADDIATMWNVPLSVEPVFAFAALTQTQLTLLRVLLIGKRAGMSPQEIKKMLPPFLAASHYVS